MVMRILRKSRKLRQLFTGLGRKKRCIFCMWQLICLSFLVIFVTCISLCLSVGYFFNWVYFSDRSFLLKHEVGGDELLNTLPSFLHPLFSLYLDKFPPSLTKASNKLVNVHVIPFSHTDPGWLFSKSSYYQGVVREILDWLLQFCIEKVTVHSYGQRISS